MGQELQVIERSPKNEVAFGQQAATALMDIVRQKKLARKFGGEKEHLYVEAWQLLGQFAGLSAEVREVDSIQVDGVGGAKASVILLDKEGREMGGAVAFCMRDEPNWKNKPWFQLASMAQTRAVSKAFRNRLAWIAVLAGYSGTPAEEMDGERPPEKTPPPGANKPTGAKKQAPASQEQLTLAQRKERATEWMVGQGKAVADCENFLKTSYADWTEEDLQALRDWAKAGFPADDIPL